MTGSLLAAVALLLAPPPSVDGLAPLDRQARDFHGAIGPAVAVHWEATPAAAPLGGDVTLSLVVRGALNPGELQRPAVAWPAADFQVLNAESPPRPLPGDAVAFDYAVRPRHAGVTEVRALPYAYYRPDRPDGKRFLTAYADPLTLTVFPGASPVVMPPAAAISAPTGGNRLPAWAWLAPVVVTFPCLWLARRTIGHRRAARARRHHPAAALAHRRLAEADRAADPVAAVRDALHDYLVARHGLPDGARTPGEIEAALPGTPGLAAVVAVLKRCDAARFSPAGDAALSLADSAAAAVAACEGGPA